jgi:acyl carrier protein
MHLPQDEPLAATGRRRQEAITAGIREVLGAHARLAVDVATLSDDADLYQAGLTSHASVSLMLALEDRFDIEFPERMLRRGAFSSITSIRTGLTELIGANA